MAKKINNAYGFCPSQDKNVTLKIEYASTYDMEAGNHYLKNQNLCPRENQNKGCIATCPIYEKALKIIY